MSSANNNLTSNHGLPPQENVLITGASRGIGFSLVEALLKQQSTRRVFAGCRNPDSSEDLLRLARLDDRVTPVKIDASSRQSVEAAARLIADVGQIDLLINTVGLLHNKAGMRPEKRLADISTDDLLLAFDVNALGTMRLALAFEPLLKKSAQPRFVSLSARVGSIGDNRMGGWYSYRASKAALNMLLKTLSIEWSRLRPRIICAALHPGTVETALSAPFTRNKAKTQVFSAAEAAGHLLGVIGMLSPDKTGGFFAWDGREIPW